MTILTNLLDRPAYTTKELCRLAKIGSRTLNNWRRFQGLPYIVLPSGHLRYPADQVNAWLAQRGHNLTPHQINLLANKNGLDRAANTIQAKSSTETTPFKKGDFND